MTWTAGKEEHLGQRKRLTENGKKKADEARKEEEQSHMQKGRDVK